VAETQTSHIAAGMVRPFTTIMQQRWCVPSVIITMSMWSDQQPANKVKISGRQYIYIYQHNTRR